jgi:hypothetical protein
MAPACDCGFQPPKAPSPEKAAGATAANKVEGAIGLVATRVGLRRWLALTEAENFSPTGGFGGLLMETP